jgi:hypothetical protein
MCKIRPALDIQVWIYKHAKHAENIAQAQFLSQTIWFRAESFGNLMADSTLGVEIPIEFSLCSPWLRRS